MKVEIGKTFMVDHDSVPVGVLTKKKGVLFLHCMVRVPREGQAGQNEMKLYLRNCFICSLLSPGPLFALNKLPITCAFH